MDNYPPALAPKFNEGGGVETPFSEWWSSVKQAFPNVPLDVAEHWLHRHWGQSLFGWMASKDYKFELGEIESGRLLEIWNTNDKTTEDAIKTGVFRASQRFWVRDRMVETGTFPEPIIALDNTDEHLLKEAQKPSWLESKPYILIEGHRRYEVAVGLLQQQKLAEKLPVWWMRRASESL